LNIEFPSTALFASPMARPLRIEYPGAVYHQTARGNASEDVFLGDGDRRLFLDLLAETIASFRWRCHGMREITRAPILSSFKRMVPRVASANRVWSSAIRRNSLSST
jgi:hypothetical protein